MKKIFLIFGFICFAIMSLAQNVTGNWQGVLTHPNDTSGFSDNFPFWLNIEQEGDTIMGQSRIELGNTKDFSVMLFKGTFKNKHLDIVENAWEESRMGEGVFINWCLKRMTFIYHWEDSTETLRGVWSSSKDCGPGEIYLHRSQKEFNKRTAQSHDYISFKDFRQKLRQEESVLGMKVVLTQVTFDANKSHLLPEARPLLKELKDVLIENPKVKINILGHTGNLGHDQYNLTLSLARAKTVKDFLEKLSISSTRIHYHGFGESRPIATNSTEDGRKQNRRVEFEVFAE
ncbi:MAG: outer membrane protein OmpA-like peptidoglycan-associated protein [Arenicella sp.]|jgi:outer membrane protein OmpA-like peptidoglycan-associated protein